MKRLPCPYEDCDWGKKNKDLSEKDTVPGYPTTVITDPDRIELDRFIGAKDAGTVLGKIEAAAQKHPGKK